MKEGLETNHFGKQYDPLWQINLVRIVIRLSWIKDPCEYFIPFDGISFPDGLPANYNTNNGFQDITCSYESYSSILEIKKHVSHTENDFSFTHVYQSDVQKIMECLNTRKTHGFDGMPAKILQLSTPVLAGELWRLINDSIDW